MGTRIDDIASKELFGNRFAGLRASIRKRFDGLGVPFSGNRHLGPTALAQTDHRAPSIFHERASRIEHILFGAAADTVTLHGNSFEEKQGLSPSMMGQDEENRRPVERALPA